MSGGYATDFGPFDEHVWLNAAHQGPPPRVAVAAAEQALREKTTPHLIEDEAFVALPRRLRQLLGRLINAPAEEIILGNSASWGLQVLANGLPWRDGDEIVVLADEFPATVFPWFVAEREGARLRQLELDTPVLRPERLEQELSARTRLVAVNWVRSLTGHVVDLAGLAEICARRDLLFVANVTQGLGALPLDVEKLPLAAISCSGFKWLCGPYATGFAWVRPDVLANLRPTQVDEDFARHLYDARSEAAHGAPVSMFQVRPKPEEGSDEEAPEQPHVETEAPEAEAERLAPLGVAQDLLRAVARKAIQDPSFREIFDSYDCVRARWPVQL